MERPEFIACAPWRLRAMKEALAEQDKFEAIFTPNGLRALFGQEPLSAEAGK